MTADKYLKSRVPKDCIWEEGNNLTNTPIELITEIMQEFADLHARQMAIEFIIDHYHNPNISGLNINNIENEYNEWCKSIQ